MYLLFHHLVLEKRTDAFGNVSFFCPPRKGFESVAVSKKGLDDFSSIVLFPIALGQYPQSFSVPSSKHKYCRISLSVRASVVRRSINTQVCRKVLLFVSV